MIKVIVAREYTSNEQNKAVMIHVVDESGELMLTRLEFEELRAAIEKAAKDVEKEI